MLVVDDQSDARDLLKRVLQDCDAAVVTAGSAEEALRAVEENEPDVLVSDIGMPTWTATSCCGGFGPSGLPEEAPARHRAYRLGALRGSDPSAAGRVPGPRRQAGRALGARGNGRERGRPGRLPAR